MKLKILFISSWYPHKLKPLNGIFVKRHASANTLDCDVSAIFIYSDKNNSIEESVEDDIYTLRGSYKIPGLKVPLFFQLIKLIRYLLLWKKLLSLYKAKRGKPDIINSNIVYPVSIMAACIKIAWGVPYVITEHWTGYFPEDGRYIGFIKKIISRIAVANAGAVITDSSKLSRTMLSLGLKNKYFTIPNVVDPEVFKIKPVKTQSIVSLPDSYFNFIHISSLDDEQKNISGIIRAFKKFHLAHPLSKLTIIWDEESKADLEQIEEPFSEDAGIFLQGKKMGAELAGLLQKADAFILFSNYENLPCVMLESFCCGVPVIATKVGDVPEFINEKNGILINSKDENQLLGAMEEIYRKKGNYNPEEIRDMILNKVRPSVVSKEFAEIYKMILQPVSISGIQHLKVLFLSSWYPTSVKPLHGIFVKRHAELLAHYCHVSVVFACSNITSGLEYKTENNVLTIKAFYKKSYSNIPLIGKLYKKISYISAWRKAMEFYRRENGKPDIIHAHIVFPASLFAAWYSLIWKIPYVITEHWTGYFPQDGRYKGFFLKRLSSIAVHRASAVSTVSVALKNKMTEAKLFNTYYVISNVVDTKIFTISSKINSDTVRFMHASLPDGDRKNIPGIIRAFKILNKSLKDSTLTIITGEEKDIKNLQQLCTSLDLKDSVSFPGWKSKEELAKLLQDSDAIVLFSNVETQGVILLEALCCGIPVIASKCGGPEEFITPKNGLLVNAGDENQLATAMETFAKNRGNYNPEEIRNSIIEMVNEESVAKKFIQVYKDVLKKTEMCGIAGVIAFNNKGIDLAGTIRLMNDTIRHRGPDGEGYLLIRNNDEITAFGKDTPQSIINSSILHKPLLALESRDDIKGILAHRRLSIIDITATGHQPLCNTSKNLWIVFNGEIYNYIELRDELRKTGHKFHTSSDTEVVLAAYTEWGYECISRFNGMWAFVIYDKNKKQLFASRDRFGVKPFYYYKDGNLFAFASEQKALLASGITSFKPNEKAIFDYWLFSAMEEEEEGMFKEIIELFPSHSFILNLETGELRKWKYYTLPYSNKYNDSNFNLTESTEKIQSLFLDSVSLRLRSDVEVASCLSGGLDSSSIVSAIYKLTGKGLNTFTTSFHDAGIDESNWAKIVSDFTHSNAHYAFPSSSELLKDLHNLIYCQDTPVWNTSTYAQFRVMQLIKENGIKVVLDGQGGDELFAGYGSYYFYYLREVLKHKGVSAFIKQSRATGHLKRYFSLLMFKNYSGILPLSQQLNTYLKIHPELQYLNRDFLKRNMERLKKEQDNFTLNEALYNDFTSILLKNYLKCEDRCSMWHSVESRTPFSDDINLIEYGFSLPSSVKVVNGELKSLFRKAMRGITPNAIIERKDKKGYMTPNRQWIAEIRNEVKYLFDNQALSDYLDTTSILKDYDVLFNQPDKPDNGRIFKLIAFSQWLEIFS